MGAYEYQVLDPQGRSQNGIAQGDSARAVRQQLREQGLTPLSVTEVDERTSAGGAAGGRLSRTELPLLLRQLATLLAAGQPLDAALEACARQSQRLPARRLLAALRSRVLEGQSLSAAMDAWPGSFPGWVRAACAAGEQSGELDSVLARLAEFAENRQSLLRELGFSLLYPLLVALVAIGVVMAMMVYVVPRVVGVFDQARQELPALTRGLIATSDWLAAHSLLALLILLVLVSLPLMVLRLPAWRRAWHRWQLRLPLVGRLVTQLDTARCCRTLALLTGSAVPVLEALPVAAGVMSNQVLADAVLEAATRVREGQSLAASLEHAGLFPPVPMRLVASGESSGRLEDMLNRAAEMLERDLETSVRGLAALLQPLMILLVGGFVLLIVLAIMLPILEFNQLLN